MRVSIESPRSADVIALLEEHLLDMLATSPEESVHALDVEALERPSVVFFSARSDEDGSLLGVGALQVHPDGTGEVKSMRTSAAARGRGVGATLLEKIVDTARARGLTEVNLETGTADYFAPAHRLYRRHGFAARAPFAHYTEDPHSTYFGLSFTPCNGTDLDASGPDPIGTGARTTPTVRME
jgi:N-acetylglutamate synthase and related acetyltransferases